jgi:hypothetical protein
MRRLEENLGAAGIELAPDELHEIDAATSGIEVRGARGNWAGAIRMRLSRYSRDAH